MMKRSTLLVAVFAFAISAMAQTPVYLDQSKPLNDRVEDALQRMTLREKINMIHAQSKFSSPGVPRLGIPEVWCTDGPHGIRTEVLWDEWDQAGWTNDSITAFPALTCLAATWDPSMAELYGKSIGEEARFRNKTVLLGPGVNIYRTPLNGRNFEYMGEDPYLSSKMVVPYVKGVQSNGVATCVKHYALNNNEQNRNNTNPILDERTLREIYLPAFQAAIQEGGSWSIMCSYNLYGGKWLSENDYLLNQVLKKEWGFDGVVISDWGAAHNMGVVKGGLDLEYGSWTNGLSGGAKNAYDSYYLGVPYMEAIQKGEFTTDELNDKCRRILRLIFRTGMNPNRPFGSLNSEAHVTAARTIGDNGIVLLKNDAPSKKASKLLPIDLNKTKKILVVGENAIKMMTVGGGSSSLKAQHEVLPLDGIKARIGNAAEIVYERGYVGDASGEYNGVVTGQDLTDSRSAEQLIADAAQAAKSADLVIFIGGLNKSDHQDAEGADREQLALPYNQDAVISALAAANKNLAVVIISGNAVEMPWVKNVPAIVQDWYIGSEAGNSLADILMGDVNPSGKLPFTYYATLDQCGAHAEGEYPGHLNTSIKAEFFGHEVPIYDMPYNEGLFVGYRYIDKKNLKPTFPFGHGLSYTTFSYGKATIDKSEISENDRFIVTVPVMNTGDREGKEVVQLYVQDVESSLVRPMKELKAFQKVTLKAGQTMHVSFMLDKRALSYYDDTKKEWVAEPGKFNILIGSSSQDIRSTVSFELK